MLTRSRAALAVVVVTLCLAGGSAPAFAATAPDRPGESYDSKSPDSEGCAYQPGRIRLSDTVVGATDVHMQLFWTSACGSVAWGRLSFPSGRSQYRDAEVQLSRWGVADAGPLQEWDNEAQWGGMLAALSGDCITLRASVTLLTGEVVEAEPVTDCS